MLGMPAPSARAPLEPSAAMTKWVRGVRVWSWRPPASPWARAGDALATTREPMIEPTAATARPVDLGVGRLMGSPLGLLGCGAGGPLDRSPGHAPAGVWRPAARAFPSKWHGTPRLRSDSRQVVGLREGVDGRVDALHPGLELHREVAGVVSRLVQVAPVEPQVVLSCGLPHVAQLALPGARVFRRVGAEPPALADRVGDVLADEPGGPAVHRAVARRVDDGVGLELRAVGEDDSVLGEVVDLPADEPDRALRDELGGADVDVVAGAATQV